jgi:hypothetical protein
VKRGRILADTEEVTGSNPVSPTKKGRYGRVTDEALDHLDRLVCGQEHPLGGATAHLGRQSP